MKLSLASHAINNTYLGDAPVINSTVDPIPTPSPEPDPQPTPLPAPIIPTDPTSEPKFDRMTVILISSSTGVGVLLLAILVWWCACKKKTVSAAEVNHLLY